SIELLKKAKDRSKLSGIEIKAAKQVMKRFNLTLEKPHDVMEAIISLKELTRIYEKKLEMHTKRKECRRENQCFELYRSKYYRKLSGVDIPKHQVDINEIREYWFKMWETTNKTSNGYDEYLVEQLPDSIELTTLSNLKEFDDIIKCQPNWKAAGIDGIINFFIKHISSVHKHLYNSIKNICLEGRAQADWFYQGITYLIFKVSPSKGSDFRPITCMSDLYKLTTKCVTQVMQLEVERRGLLADNQLGIVRRVQGAKEQAMLDLSLNKEYGHLLKSTWIDAKKVLDFIDHKYLVECISKLGFPKWIPCFVKEITSKWSLNVRVGPERIVNKRVNKGILQCDSLSPLLFVLCIYPLSRRLNERYPKVSIHAEEISHATNHLLFIDDLKLLATNSTVMGNMVKETESFFKTIGLEINRESRPRMTLSAKILLLSLMVLEYIST
ncbi:LINE-1 retrotransposable element ORF2 protein, partial [Astathelohania contejeani]